MPAVAVAAAAPSLLIFDDGDEDGFGDFEFAPSAPPAPAEADDEWGDFVASPSSAPAPPPPDPGSKQWERPRGALPLSLFGDEEGAEAEAEPPVFINGFASQKPAKELKGDLKDLIVNMYGPAVAAATVNRNGVYEKKPGYANGNGIEKEGNGLEKEAVYANGNEMKIVGNRMGDSQEAADQHRVVRVSEDLFESNDFKFGSVIGYENYIPQTNLQTGYNDRGNVLESTLQNGDESDDDNCWEFKCAFSEVEDAASSPGHQGIGNPRESNLGDLSVPYESNKKSDQGELFVDHNGPSYDPTYAGTGTKDVSSGGGLVFSDIFANLYDKADQIYNVQSIKNSLEDGPKSAEFDPNRLDVHDDSEFNEMQWEFQKASGAKFGDQDSAIRPDQNVSVESVQNTFLDLYRRLREESLFLIVHHLNDLKVANITGEQAKVTEMIIQEAYKKIQEALVSEDDNIERHQSRDVCVSQLLDVIKEPHFQAMEQEYCLHDRILLAGKDLKAALELFEHTISTLQILGAASKEEINAYVNAWSRMALGCLQELKHGAMIWAESLRANVRAQILSQGNQYFIGLGEVFRVTEVLRASSRQYKPWLLLSRGDSSEVLLTCLEKCSQLWTVSGLEKALESISSAKPLLESIKRIHDLDQASTQRAFRHEETLCNLSLLPMGLLHGMGGIVWDVEHYYTKLANLWANRISCDPPKLPHINVKWD